ncbi:MAG: hypothetical protein C4299_04085 [Thermoleophilia bacterium]
MEVYASHREALAAGILEDSVASHILRLAEGGWRGTAAALLADLNATAEASVTRARFWPQTPRALAGYLRRIAPELRRLGVEIEFSKEGRNRTRIIALEKVADDSGRYADDTVRTRNPVQDGIADHADGADGVLHPGEGEKEECETFPHCGGDEGGRIQQEKWGKQPSAPSAPSALPPRRHFPADGMRTVADGMGDGMGDGGDDEGGDGGWVVYEI